MDGPAVAAMPLPGLAAERLQRYREHAEICKVLTDVKRLAIVDALRAGERSVGDLAELLGCELANTSQHLAVLRRAGLVATRHAGATVYYSLAEPRILNACDIVAGIVEHRRATPSPLAFRVADPPSGR